jgi:hypothetical protein
MIAGSLGGRGPANARQWPRVAWARLGSEARISMRTFVCIILAFRHGTAELFPPDRLAGPGHRPGRSS